MKTKYITIAFFIFTFFALSAQKKFEIGLTNTGMYYYNFKIEQIPNQFYDLNIISPNIFNPGINIGTEFMERKIRLHVEGIFTANKGPVKMKTLYPLLGEPENFQFQFESAFRIDAETEIIRKAKKDYLEFSLFTNFYFSRINLHTDYYARLVGIDNHWSLFRYNVTGIALNPSVAYNVYDHLSFQINVPISLLEFVDSQDLGYKRLNASGGMESVDLETIFLPMKFRVRAGMYYNF